MVLEEKLNVIAEMILQILPKQEQETRQESRNELESHDRLTSKRNAREQDPDADSELIEPN